MAMSQMHKLLQENADLQNTNVYLKNQLIAEKPKKWKWAAIGTGIGLIVGALIVH